MAEGMRNEREAKGGEGRIKEGRKPSHEFFMKIRKPIVNMPRPTQRRVVGEEEGESYVFFWQKSH